MGIVVVTLSVGGVGAFAEKLLATFPALQQSRQQVGVALTTPAVIALFVGLQDCLDFLEKRFVNERLPDGLYLFIRCGVPFVDFSNADVGFVAQHPVDLAGSDSL
jgi:hypothetical protein